MNVTLYDWSLGEQPRLIQLPYLHPSVRSHVDEDVFAAVQDVELSPEDAALDDQEEVDEDEDEQDEEHLEAGSVAPEAVGEVRVHDGKTSYSIFIQIRVLDWPVPIVKPKAPRAQFWH